jgi:two-component system sensor histidine kinase/response regulator
MDYSTIFLVVDDMEGMRRILTNSLHQMGMQNIVTAAHGAEAWRLIQAQPVDVVISDWNMPVMSGLDLLKKIRANPQHANLPVLMMTAETERHQVQVAIEAGVSEYMIKPFNVGALEAKLKKVIDQPHPKTLRSLGHVPAILKRKGMSSRHKSIPNELALAANAAPDAELSKPTLLVVDDVPDNLDVLVELLSDNYQVRAANSGERALKILDSGKIPDLILLDVMMPEMDGFEVCRRIKANPASADIPVIFLTAMSESTDVAKGFALGAVDFVTKPADPPILRARIDTHLKLRQAFTELKRNRIELIEQNAVLQDNIRLRDEFDRIAQHDLKNPVAGIINFSASLLSDLQVSEEHKEIVRYIEQAAYSVLNMVNLSLDLYKMEQGTYEFNPGSVDLAPLLTRIVREMSSEMLSRQIYIQFKAEGQATESPASLPVLGEELLSYSMLNNLIKNAMEAAADGTEIDIDLLPPHREDEPGRQGMVQIRISNDGTVPREIREIFFEKFATSGKPGGTGLGTFSARLIAQTQGGDIAMETSDEQGRTTLTVNLPYALQADLTDLTDSTT